MSKIKVLIIAVFAIFTSLTSFAQQYNTKLTVKYNVTELDNLKQNDPNQFEFLNYFIDDVCYFVDMPDKKIDFIELEKINPKTGEIIQDYVLTEKDMNDFNPLEYNCEINATQNGFYKVGNTGKLLIIPKLSNIENRIENEKRILKNNY